MINENSAQQIDDTNVTAALNGILTTDKFSASPQMSAFLKYVVEQTLLGNTRRIKAFTVGIEALGKSPNFDPQTDPSVRVLAKRLRSSLDAYYEQNPNTEIFIEMKPGSYIPKFILRSEMAATQPMAMNAGYQGSPMENTQAHMGETAETHGSHIGIQQQEPETHNTGEATAEGEESRKAGMEQLWTAYRNASKVA